MYGLYRGKKGTWVSATVNTVSNHEAQVIRGSPVGRWMRSEVLGHGHFLYTSLQTDSKSKTEPLSFHRRIGAEALETNRGSFLDAA